MIRLVTAGNLVSEINCTAGPCLAYQLHGVLFFFLLLSRLPPLAVLVQRHRYIQKGFLGMEMDVFLESH